MHEICPIPPTPQAREASFPFFSRPSKEIFLRGEKIHLSNEKVSGRKTKNIYLGAPTQP
jgi:hypothetical protein